MLDSFTSREKTIILKGQAAKKAVMTKVFALSDYEKNIINVNSPAVIEANDIDKYR